MIDFILVAAASVLFFFCLFEKNNIKHAILLSVGVTPLYFSVILQYLFLIFPEHSVLFYKICFYIFGLLQFVYVVKNKNSINLSKDDWIYIIPVLMSLFVILKIPEAVTSFDPINYRLIGRELAGLASLKDFPFVVPGRESSLFSWFAHPLGLPLTFSFLQMFNAGFLIPFVSSFFYIILIIFMFALIREHSGNILAISASTMLAFTPLFFESAKEGFTEPLRMLMFLFACYMISQLGDEKPLLTGLLTGFALNTHLIGIVALPSSVLAIFFVSKSKSIKMYFMHTLTALFVGGFAYINNLIKFGKMDTSQYLFSHYPEKLAKLFVNFQMETRGKGSLHDVILNGYLSPFFDLKHFALAFIIPVVVYILFIRRAKLNAMSRSLIAFIGTYLFFHLLPVHYNSFIMNSRYIMTILPIVIILGMSFKFQNWQKGIIVFLTISSVFISFNLGSRYLKKSVFYYKDMRDYINEKFTTGDQKVLLIFCPDFFLYNGNFKGVSHMDPSISDLFFMQSHNDVLEFLQQNKFTHIMVPYDPTPFVKNSQIRTLFDFNGLLKNEKTSTIYHLYKINYNYESLETFSNEPVYEWNAQSSDPIIVYNNKKNYEFKKDITDNSLNVTVYDPDSSVITAWAKGKPWQQDCSYLKAGKGFMKIQLCAKADKSMSVTPILIMFDSNGERIQTHTFLPLELNETMTDHQLLSKTLHSRISSPYFIIPKECSSLWLGYNFFRDFGRVEFEKLTIID